MDYGLGYFDTLLLFADLTLSSGRPFEVALGDAARWEDPETRLLVSQGNYIQHEVARDTRP